MNTDPESLFQKLLRERLHRQWKEAYCNFHSSWRVAVCLSVASLGAQLLGIYLGSMPVLLVSCVVAIVAVLTITLRTMNHSHYWKMQNGRLIFTLGAACIQATHKDVLKAFGTVDHFLAWADRCQRIDDDKRALDKAKKSELVSSLRRSLHG